MRLRQELDNISTGTPPYHQVTKVRFEAGVERTIFADYERPKRALQSLMISPTVLPPIVHWV